MVARWEPEITCKTHRPYIHTAGSDGNMMVSFIKPLDFPSFFHISHNPFYSPFISIVPIIFPMIIFPWYILFPIVFSMIYSHDIFPWYIPYFHDISIFPITSPWKLRHLWIRKTPRRAVPRPSAWSVKPSKRDAARSSGWFLGRRKGWGEKVLEGWKKWGKPGNGYPLVMSK